MIGKWSRMIIGVIGALWMVFFLCGLDGVIYAESAKDLLNRINKELRQTERDMFSGKTDKAIASLNPIREQFAKVKAADPNNPKIKTLENKFTKLVKDLERRTGKELGGGTLTAADASTRAKLPPAPASNPLPVKSAIVQVTGDADTLAKEANDLLRKAERNLFSGKSGEAGQQLNQARAMIDKIKADDPEHSKINSLESKYSQIQKKLEAGKPKDAGQQSVSGQTSQGKQTGTAVPDVPFNARRYLRSAEQSLASIEKNLSMIADSAYTGDKNSLLRRTENALPTVADNLEKAKSVAAEKGVTSHPSFDAVAAGLVEAQKKFAQSKSDYEAEKAVASAKSEEVNSDVQALLAEYNRVKDIFDSAPGTVIYYNALDTVKTLLDKIEAFESNDVDKLKPVMEAFALKYGATRDQIDKKAESMGYSGQIRASFPYTELVQGIGNVKKTCTVMADDLIRRAEDMKSNLSRGVSDFQRANQYARMKTWGAVAERFEIENPRVKEFNSTLDSWIEEDQRIMNAKIDKVTWPGHADNAPRDADKLAEVVYEFLQKESDKLAAKDQDSRQMLSVVITGPWRVFKKNILGEPIQYGLPILGAVQHESEKARNLARVYQLTMLTEEFKGVEMAPPFIGSAVGNSYYIRPAQVR